MSSSKIKKAFMLFLVINLLESNAINLANAQEPIINFSQSNYSFTKGIAINVIQSPNNSGGAIPNKIRGDVEESGIGEVNASKIVKSGNNNLESLMIQVGEVEKNDLTTKD